MTEDGYGVVHLDDLPWTRHGGDTAWASLTGPVAAVETEVDALRLGPDDAVELAPAPEQLLVPLEGTVSVDGAEAELARPGAGLVPAGALGRLGADGPATLVVISAPAEANTDTNPRVIDLEAVELTVPEISDIAMAFLTERLGCAGMKVNARLLEPGEAVLYHTEGTQEELFVPLEEPASFRVADETYQLSVGSVACVAPEIPRSAINDGESEALWVMVGAPPSGGPTDWDPGAEIVD